MPTYSQLFAFLAFSLRRSAVAICVILGSTGLGVLAAQQDSGQLVAAAVATALVGSWAATMRWMRRERHAATNRAQDAPLPESIRAVDSAFAEATSRMEELRRRLADQQVAYLEFASEADPKERTTKQHRREWMLFGLGAFVSVPVGIFVNWIS